MVDSGWTATSVATATGAGLYGPEPTEFRAIVTDSRKVREGDLFIALAGETFDGHDFVDAALKAGAAGVMVSRDVPAAAEHVVLQVPDTLLAYGDLGRAWRRRYDPLVVGITGSTGKSSTKQIVATVLRERFETLASEGSFNNEVGLPATLLQLERRHEAVVLELAMRGEGQIDYLARIAEPSIGVITNIGVSHLELLGSREAVARAKGELLDHLGADGTAVLNADDPYLPSQASRHGGRTIWYGFARQAEVRAEEVELQGLSGSRFRLATPRGAALVRLPLPGRHMVSNALAAAAVGVAVGLSVKQIAAGLEACRTLPLRLEVVQLDRGATVINDSYNAAPDSVRAALQVLASEPTRGRRIACLGDMLELGQTSATEHLRIGHEAAEAADLVIAVGELGAGIGVGARDAGAEVRTVADADAAGTLLAELLREGDLVLLKASRAVGLDRALATLERRG